MTDFFIPFSNCCRVDSIAVNDETEGIVRLSRFLTAHAQRIGSKVALIYQNEELTFRGLRRSSDRVGASLASLGVKLRDRVALYLSNCLELTACFFGIIVKPGRSPFRSTCVWPRPKSPFRWRASRSSPHSSTRASQGASTKQIESAFHGLLGGGPGRLGYSDEVIIRNTNALLPEVPIEQDEYMISYTSGITGKSNGAVFTQSTAS